MKTVSTTWHEGRLFDLWMVVHFLGGVTGGFSNVFFELSTPGVFLVGLGIMLVWEVGEYVVGIRESAENRLVDVVVGIAGVFVALQLAAWFGTTAEYAALGVSALAFGLGGVSGWLAYRRRRAKT